MRVARVVPNLAVPQVNPMKRILSSLIVAAGLVALAPLAVHANDVSGPSSSVPELDPSALSAAVALLVGGSAVIGGRRRRA